MGCRVQRELVFTALGKRENAHVHYPIFVNQYVHSSKLKLNNFDKVCLNTQLNHVHIESLLSWLIPSCFKNLEMELCLYIYLSVI